MDLKQFCSKAAVHTTASVCLSWQVSVQQILNEWSLKCVERLLWPGGHPISPTLMMHISYSPHFTYKKTEVSHWRSLTHRLLRDHTKQVPVSPLRGLRPKWEGTASEQTHIGDKRGGERCSSSVQGSRQW